MDKQQLIDNYSKAKDELVDYILLNNTDSESSLKELETLLPVGHSIEDCPAFIQQYWNTNFNNQMKGMTMYFIDEVELICKPVYGKMQDQAAEMYRNLRLSEALEYVKKHKIIGHVLC